MSLSNKDIKYINNSDLIMVRTRSGDNHLAYYHSDHKRYIMFCNSESEQLLYVDHYDSKRYVCYECRARFVRNRDCILKNYYCYLPSYNAVSLRCCMKTTKGKRCKFHSNTHGSFCRIHYGKLIDIMGKRIPKQIIMSILNL